jgi:hypothetical protein
MSEQDFLRFLNEEQQESQSIEYVRELLSQLRAPNETAVSYRTFEAYMSSHANHAFNPVCLDVCIHQHDSVLWLLLLLLLALVSHR